MVKKAQSSIEFLLLIGAVLFFFVVLITALQFNIGQKTRERQGLIARDIAQTVKSEIDLASSSTDGYLREFQIPLQVLNLNYNINIYPGSESYVVYLNSTEGRIGLTIPVQNVTGNINKGYNNITKEDGVVYLNTVPP